MINMSFAREYVDETSDVLRAIIHMSGSNIAWSTNTVFRQQA